MQAVNTIAVMALFHIKTLAHAKMHKHAKTITSRISTILFIFFSPFISENA